MLLDTIFLKKYKSYFLFPASNINKSYIPISGDAQMSKCFYKDKSLYNLPELLVFVVVDLILIESHVLVKKYIHYFRGLTLRHMYVSYKTCKNILQLSRINDLNPPPLNFG